jgi:hypothetical protein
MDRARELLDAAQVEYHRAQQEKGGAAVTLLRNACGKGWLAALEAANGFFVKQGVSEGDLPDTDRGRRYFAGRYMDRGMRRFFVYLRQTFHLDGYYEGILEFEDMPRYFDELREFIDQVEGAPSRDVPGE